ncbi:MAG: PorP/SprF family type IX secretion system membrane protein [Candidatus Saccharibacteria bacterium]
MPCRSICIKITGLVILISFILRGELYAQDPYFSQYFLNPVYMNPAYTGSMKVPRFGVQYRNQWPALNKAYTTYFASFDTYLPKNKSGIGLLAWQDVQADGIFTQSSIKAIYSKEIRLSHQWTMYGSLSAGTQINALEYNRLIFPDGLDVIYGQYLPSGESLPESAHTVFPDFGAGILFFNKKYFFGLAGDHLNRPDQSMYQAYSYYLERKYTAHFEASLPWYIPGHLRKYCTFNPNIILQSQGDELNLTMGLYAIRRCLTLGIWSRQTLKKGSDVIAMVGFAGKQFKTALTYDLNLWGVGLRSQGAVELSIAVLLKDPGIKSIFPFYEMPGEWEIR